MTKSIDSKTITTKSANHTEPMTILTPLLLKLPVAMGITMGISFNSSFGSYMVLQQQPARPCVYGMLGVGGTAASVKISDSSNYNAPVVITVMSEGSAWKACFPPINVGGDHTITATCMGCINTTDAVLRHVTFGDVYYCGGQSNMALPLLHSYSRNISRDAISAGKYENIRIHGLEGNMNPYQPWATLKQALTAPPSEVGGDASDPYRLQSTKAGSNMFVQFSATCYYFGQSLSDKIVKSGGTPSPIGLIHTAWGGSTIEQWLSNQTIAKCSHTRIESSNQEYHDSRVMPFVNMAVKGFVWYQGENDCHGTMGNSVAKVGYSCLMASLVQQWRELWSCPTCAFGIVTLASSGSEGAGSHAMGAMRQAQTAGNGVLPANEGIMANTFMAQAYDLDDQWSGDRGPCVEVGWNKTSPAVDCCGKDGGNSTTCTLDWADTCANMCYANVHTAQYMGGIHPRSKKPVGERLAQAAFNSVYGGSAAFTGPTLAGCALTNSTLTIEFDISLLRGDTVVVQRFGKPNFTPYYHGHGNPMFHGGSQLYVQTIASSFCVETLSIDDRNASSPVYCPTWAGGAGKSVTQPAPMGRFPTFGGNGASTVNDPNEFNEGWINLPLHEGNTPSSIIVDLSPLKGAVPTAVRYAWVCRRGSELPSDRLTIMPVLIHLTGAQAHKSYPRTLPQGIVDCCDLNDPATFTSEDCLANCPVMSSSGLPANPFIAKIINGKCSCVAPQICGDR